MIFIGDIKMKREFDVNLFICTHCITFCYNNHRDSRFKKITSFLCVSKKTKKLSHKFALNFCATLLSCHSFQISLASHAHHCHSNTTIIKGVVRLVNIKTLFFATLF